MATQDNDKLAKRLVQEIESCEIAKGNRMKRWDEVRKAYYNESDGPSWLPYPGAYQGHWNLMKVKLDQLSTTVTASLTSSNPYFVCDKYNDDEGKRKIEDTVQFFLDKDRYKETLKEVAAPAGYSGVGWIKAEWTGKGFDFKVIQPEDTVVYPSWEPDMNDAKMVGSVRYMRKSKIIALQEDGTFLKGDISVSTSSDSDNLNATSAPVEDNIVEDKDGKVEVWDIVYEDEDGKIYRCMVAKDSELLLLKEPWVYNTLWFGEYSYVPRPDRDGYYPANYPGADLMELQFNMNDQISTLMNGARFNAYGVHFTKNALDSTKSVIKTEPGGFYSVDEPVQSYNPKVDLSIIPGLISLFEAQADKIIRVSNMSTGQPGAGVDTATEANIIQAGQQVSINDFLETLSWGCIQNVKFVCNALFIHWDEWFPLYGERLGLEESDRELFKDKEIWKPAVTSVGGTPQMQVAMIQQLVGFAQDPEMALDKYELSARILVNAERMGLPDATSLQIPNDIVGAATRFAQQFGLSPELLMAAIAQTANMEQQQVMSDPRVLESDIMQMVQEQSAQGQPQLPPSNEEEVITEDAPIFE